MASAASQLPCCARGVLRQRADALQGPQGAEDERTQGRGGAVLDVWQSLERPVEDQPGAAQSSAEASAQASQARESAQLLNEVSAYLGGARVFSHQARHTFVFKNLHMQPIISRPCSMECDNSVMVKCCYYRCSLSCALLRSAPESSRMATWVLLAWRRFGLTWLILQGSAIVNVLRGNSLQPARTSSKPSQCCWTR